MDSLKKRVSNHANVQPDSWAKPLVVHIIEVSINNSTQTKRISTLVVYHFISTVCFGERFPVALTAKRRSRATHHVEQKTRKVGTVVFFCFVGSERGQFLSRNTRARSRQAINLSRRRSTTLMLSADVLRVLSMCTVPGPDVVKL